MDELCAPTLDALDEFIQAQKSLLAKTQSDIARLRDLKAQAAEDIEGFVENLSERLDDEAFKLSAREQEFTLRVSKPIQWDTFQGLDPTALRTLSSSLLASTISRTRPAKSQRSPLSPLQAFVKTAKRTSYPEAIAREREREKIRELKRMQIRGGRAGKGGRSLKLPSRFGMMGVFVRHDVEDEAAFEVDIDNDVDVSAPTVRTGGKGALNVNGKGYVGGGKCPALLDELMDTREDSHEALCSPRLSQEHTPPCANDLDASLPMPVPLPPPSKPRSSRTSSRPKRTKGGKNPALLVSESAGSMDYDVDVDMDDFAFDVDQNMDAGGSDHDDFEDPVYEAERKGCVNNGRSSTNGRRSASASAPAYLHSASQGTSSSRGKPKSKSTGASKAKTKKGKKAGKVDDDDDDDDDDEAAAATTTKKPKPKPETYKQAWSDDEQRLLEQLLDEIPEGEKFRWQKISKAMGGKRTPRQVASR
ncbi:hypothetical protein BKA70DRAFT_1346235, partial [Coprinopsis sp. MPI-PUGE-AT-0042]